MDVADRIVSRRLAGQQLLLALALTYRPRIDPEMIYHQRHRCFAHWLAERIFFLFQRSRASRTRSTLSDVLWLIRLVNRAVNRADTLKLATASEKRTFTGDNMSN